MGVLELHQVLTNSCTPKQIPTQIRPKRIVQMKMMLNKALKLTHYLKSSV